MKLMQRLVCLVMMTVFGFVGGIMVLGAEPAQAETVDTSIFGPVDVGDQGEGIDKILILVVRILVYGLGAAAVIGVVIAGILYLTARDNEQQVVRAKQRLFEIMIGLLAWAVMATVVEWLVPGGILNRLGDV